MILLKESGLIVSILDPAADRAKLGSRYCAGGYIWQVEDEKLGPLLSGPFYPDPTTPFDGQGAPEVFEIAWGADQAKVGGEVCVPGVGRVRRGSPVKPFHVRDNPAVIEFAEWQTKAEEDSVRMQARQRFGEFAAFIDRRVDVRDRTVSSRTEIRNEGNVTLPVRWFAHPFFPWTSVLCHFSLECSVPSNPGFSLGADGLLRRREEHDWKSGCYQPLNLCFGVPLRVEQKHPLLGSVEVFCDFPVAALPVWGNARTFSFEPYFHTVLSPGASADWAIRYRF